MTIRDFAKNNKHEVIGKLTRYPELEFTTDPFTGDKIRTKEKFYIDEGGNEYWAGKKGFSIVTADGSVI